MAWPTPQDYNEAVQNPRLSFTDPDLRAGLAELNKIGLPRPIAGGFACVYKIQTGGNLWAARCFLSEVTDQQQRYEAISKHLAAAKLPHTVPFTYLAGGIKVQGRAYPLVKMQWVQGESLSAFVGRSIGYSDTLLSLAKVWSRLLADLKSASIAHGDLQHGNVVVVGDQLRLLDYDGMFVPSFLASKATKSGIETTNCRPEQDGITALTSTIFRLGSSTFRSWRWPCIPNCGRSIAAAMSV